MAPCRPSAASRLAGTPAGTRADGRPDVGNGVGVAPIVGTTRVLATQGSGPIGAARMPTLVGARAGAFIGFGTTDEGIIAEPSRRTTQARPATTPGV